MRVTIVNRARQAREWGSPGLSYVRGYLQTVEIADTCPRCGGPRGEARLVPSVEDGEHYSVSRWDNECGHVDMYPDVLAEAAALAETR